MVVHEILLSWFGDYQFVEFQHMLILLRSIHCSTYGVADFLLFYPKVTIKELDSIIEDGMFVATITGFLEGEDW